MTSSVRASLCALSSLSALLVSASHAAPSFPLERFISTQVETVSNVLTPDFSRDGRPDLVIRQRLGQEVLWQENLGGGVFRPAGHWQGTQREFCVAVADLDGDGLLDLLTRDNGGDPNANHLFIHYGTTPGAVAAEQTPLTTGPELGGSVHILDLDGDGRTDIATTHVYLNQGSRTYLTAAAGQTLPGPIIDPAPSVNGQAWDIRLGALPDLYFAGPGMVRYPNLGGGVFGPAQTVIPGLPGDGARAMCLVSVPGISTRPCLLRNVEIASGAKKLELYRLDDAGDGTVTATLVGSSPIAGRSTRPMVRTLTTLDTPQGPRIIAQVEKKPDSGLYRATAQEVRISVVKGKVSLKLVALGGPEATSQIPAAADVNGDGITDLIVASNGIPTGPSTAPVDQIGWHAGRPGTPFSNRPLLLSGGDNGADLVWAGDLDHHGAADLITIGGAHYGSPQRVTLWMNHDRGAFFEPVTLPVTGTTVEVVAGGDLFNDGWTDLLLAVTQQPSSPTQKTKNTLVLIDRLPNGRVQQKTLLTVQGRPWLHAELITARADGMPGLRVFTDDNFQGPPLTPTVYLSPSPVKFLSKPESWHDLRTYRDVDGDGTLDRVLADHWEKLGPAGQTVASHDFPALTQLFPGRSASSLAGYYLAPVELDFDGDRIRDYELRTSPLANFSLAGAVVAPIVARPGATSSATWPFATGAANAGKDALLLNNTTTAGYGDVDGDGDLDVIYEPSRSGDVPYTSPVWQENLGNLVFAPPAAFGTALPAPRPYASAHDHGLILMADIDGDGVRDIISSSAELSSRLRWIKVTR